MKRLSWLVIPALTFALGIRPAPAAAAAQPPLAVSQTERPLAQGLNLIQFERLYPRGWVNGHLLRVDLANPAITTDLLTAPGVNQVEPLSAMAGRTGAVAGINGDFFDIGQTNIALGSVVKSGQFLQSRIPDWPNAAGVGRDRIGQLLELTLDGTVTLPGGSYPLGTMNLPTVQSHTIGIYTPLWTLPRTNAMAGATEAREVIVQGGKVVSVSPTVTDRPIPADGFVLVGREEFAAPVASLKVGDPVSVSYNPKPAVQWAVGGNHVLVRNGQLQSLNAIQIGPRSALGFSVDGRQMFLLTVDGRSEASGGVTLLEMAELIRSFGAYNALELDGGGSSTMVARLPGDSILSLINRPSDGKERRIPNGVGVIATPGSGQVRRLEVVAANRIFPGLTRRLAVRAYDEQYGLVPLSSVTWRAVGNGSVSGDGLLKASAPGRITVTASNPQASGNLEVRVLGPLDRIAASVDGLRLAPGQSERFLVRGYDAAGYMAPIDSADLTLTYDSQVLQVVVEGDGLRVTVLKEGVGQIRLAVQGREVQVPFVASQATTTVDALDRAAGWSFAKYPDSVTGSVSAVPGRAGLGMKLTYQFGGSGNRAAYMQASPLLELPGRPEAVGLWVNGDGKGAWLRLVLVDATGAQQTLNLARNVDWTGWRYLEAPVPAGTAYPLKLYRIYPVETDQAKQYSGELVFDDLTVRAPAPLPTARPRLPVPADPMLQPGQGGWTFALMTGLALSPTGTSEDQAVEQIHRVLATGPAFLLVDPLLVSPEAEVLIAREVAGQTPVLRLNRSVQSLDRNGVRFLVVGTEKGGIRATDFAQLQGLQTMLTQAAGDPAVKRVVVVARDLPTRFTDTREGALLTRWLTEFREHSGKPVAYVGTGGASTMASQVEGVPYLEVGGPGGPVILRVGGTPWLWLE